MLSSRAYGRPHGPTKNVNFLGLFQVGCVLVIAVTAWYVHDAYVTRLESWIVVEKWLRNYGLIDCKVAVWEAGMKTLVHLGGWTLPLDPRAILLPREKLDKLGAAIQLYQDELLLVDWLQDNSLDAYYNRLVAEGIHTLQDIEELQEQRLHQHVLPIFSKADSSVFMERLQDLHKLKPDLRQYRKLRHFSILGKTSFVGGILFLIFTITICIGMKLNSMYAVFHDHRQKRRSLLDFMTGQYLDPQRCGVSWSWQKPQLVGQTLHFTIKFFQGNGRPYPISSQDGLHVEVFQGLTVLSPSIQLGGTHPSDANKTKVTFTVHRSGTYKIIVMLGGRHVKGSPFEKTFVPGPMEPRKSQFISQGSVVVCGRGKLHQLILEPRDDYGNLCEFNPDESLEGLFEIRMTESGNQMVHHPDLHCTYQAKLKQVSVTLTLDHEGCFLTVVTYKGTRMKNSEFHTMVLAESDLATVNKLSAKRSHNVHFEARLLSTNYHSPSDRGKKVYCYISPKQLTIKEFHLKIIPKKLFTFRVCPSTKFQFLGNHNQLELPILSVEDGCQSPVLLALRERNIVAAVYSSYLLQNIGGSETFSSKQDFFYHEIRQVHSKRIHDKYTTIKINREKMLESSIKATKHFSTSDWCKNFEIVFQNEEGLDWGGLRREWFELVCIELFDPNRSQLFRNFKDDPQALVHPNYQRPSSFKLKCYEFAGKIVGKCLYESSLGGSYRQLVKAKFSRSFLAQLIGLRVHYKYFETDDPDLYTTKIRFIEENDVDDLDMTFSEEEFVNGQLDKVVDLIPNGSKTPVTNANKNKYLDVLAQYRLSSCVRDEIEYFLKGLNELIPDNLLSIFDENELELLMCGTGNYSIADFKDNHVLCGSSPEFQKVIEWFWTIITGYTQEEMARLLQFTTGCSQLPPGGFSQLTPKFQIIPAPTYNVLPTAHTCFNQLCLPDYNTLEEMHQALKLAITEGNQGFGMV